MSQSVPTEVDIVIVGGGIVGASVAYHLAQRGATNVVLLERGQLTCGTTWHAAGLVGQLRATLNLTRLAQYTARLYSGLAAETGQATGFKQTGSLAVAQTSARLEELKRGASMGRSFGLEVEILTPGEAQARWPLLASDDLEGAVYLPKDGQTNPVDTTQALARGARSRGVKIIEHCRVTAIHTTAGRVTGVRLHLRGRLAQHEAGALQEKVVAGSMCCGIVSFDIGRRRIDGQHPLCL